MRSTPVARSKAFDIAAIATDDLSLHLFRRNGNGKRHDFRIHGIGEAMNGGKENRTRLFFKQLASVRFEFLNTSKMEVSSAFSISSIRRRRASSSEKISDARKFCLAFLQHLFCFARRRAALLHVQQAKARAHQGILRASGYAPSCAQAAFALAQRRRTGKLDFFRFAFRFLHDAVSALACFKRRCLTSISREPRWPSAIRRRRT
jgi:hypothetical protein